MSLNQTVLRHKPLNRVVHWTVAITGILTLLSGLSFMFAPLHFLSYVYGTPQLARILHPFGAIIMTVGLFFLAARYWKYNRFEKGDMQWMLSVKDVLTENEDKVPPAGHYNAGQKMILRQFLACGVLLLVSGIVAWRAYFSADFSIDTVRIALIVHSIAAFVFCLSLIIHAYMAYWVQGSIDGMLEGKVSLAWAKKHHPRWFRELEAGKKH
ncbi:TPA: formate dehydrogenase subunit gamma [Photobacterium damselae]|uniref:Formate dehydrogenase subunit gamma n=3 Tax=Photobacterium damselae TaxID=38293 RepID=A0A1C3DVB5_PHODD|nr:formate dehydrogenase subunit gamma [Photobacterium damselae]ARR48552.1 formate dehydrogenase subunit gamma [Photobacterium damselae subsp. damselae]AWK82625.1 formate dehydrogenase subunit gamma [Photobacterium damselae]EHA1081024.1 formate dehydrogenase subunit gamma [Photobacterium damselae]EJN6961519.1 formate dehydrogenase subunit gamma [Photobacterium damselae]ELI6450265.1 formate dehydrogenase subunit gamma [Photobacterium damselae]